MTIAWRVGLVLFLMGLAGTPAEAQTAATLVGEVVDATGGRLADVRITSESGQTADVSGGPASRQLRKFGWRAGGTFTP